MPLNFCAIDPRITAQVDVELRIDGVAVPGKRASATFRRDHAGRTTLSISGKLVIPKGSKIQVFVIPKDGDSFKILDGSLVIERLSGDC